MDIHYNYQSFDIPELYCGYDDVPSLTLNIHLHAWVFPDQSGPGEATFRVEIREGDPASKENKERPAIGIAFVKMTPTEMIECKAYSPLAQAVMDGVLTHEKIQSFFVESAARALNVPIPDSRIRQRKTIDKAFFNPKLRM
ncbi:MAG: hypothetical protein HQL50_09205 [Magnetococcales bacterium]|nr:hypothetical protein [Magnetococcales bacterium]